MKKLNISATARKVLKVLMWVFLFLVGCFIVLFVWRMFHYYDVEETNDQVLKIHSTKLKIESVTGEILPLDPGAEGDKTIQGIDANANGVRDDVEIAIFKEYPGDSNIKTRAVLMQYALALQMETTQPFVNEEIATEVITEQGRADTCLSDELVPRINPESSRSLEDMEKINKYILFIEEKQFNTDARKEAQKSFYKYLRSYSESDNLNCDIDFSNLSK